MGLYRKRPVVIEARRYRGENAGREIVEWINASGGTAEGPKTWGGHRRVILIETLEGPHITSPGDWVIRGVHGEFYPCKPGIFDQTYDAVEGNA